MKLGFTDIPDYQVRLLIPVKHEPWPNDDLDPLIKSIADKGILKPLVVVDLDDSQTYAVIDGNRRLRALLNLGIETTPIRLVHTLPALLENMPAFTGAKDPKGISIPYWQREIAFGGIYRNGISPMGRKYLRAERSRLQTGSRTAPPGFGFRNIVSEHFGLNFAKLSRLSAAVSVLEKAPEPDRPQILRDLAGRINRGEISAEQVYEHFRSFGPIGNRLNDLGAKVDEDQFIRIFSSLRILNSFLSSVVLGNVDAVSSESRKKLCNSLTDLRRSARQAIKALEKEE